MEPAASQAPCHDGIMSQNNLFLLLVAFVGIYLKNQVFITIILITAYVFGCTCVSMHVEGTALWSHVSLRPA